jgi:hypothetical protein
VERYGGEHSAMASAGWQCKILNAEFETRMDESWRFRSALPAVVVNLLQGIPRPGLSSILDLPTLHDQRPQKLVENTFTVSAMRGCLVSFRAYGVWGSGARAGGNGPCPPGTNLWAMGRRLPGALYRKGSLGGMPP